MTSRSARVAAGVNLAAKILLVTLLLYSVANQDLARFAGKAMTTRALTYPIAALIVPLVWLAMGRPRPYPHVADALLVAPFLIDVAGNVQDLYNTVVWFDDVAHAMTWMLLVLAVGLLLIRLRLPPWVTGALCVGFGAVSHVLWEIIEYLLMVSGSSGLQLTYGDTIGDLAMSLSGSVVAGLIAGWLARDPARRRPPIGPIGLSEPTVERGLLVQDDEAMGGGQ